MADIVVRHEGGDRFSVSVRGHLFLVDQPDGDRGRDLGPTPTELFVASLASCVGFYAERYLVRHDLPLAGLEVHCRYEMSDQRPARVGSIEIEVVLPAELGKARREALQRVVEHCTVHNSLRMPPEVATSITSRVVAA
jgi:uncharacterized OsmC-like protein